jgi:hypothetical protein
MVCMNMKIEEIRNLPVLDQMAISLSLAVKAETC